MRVAVEERNQSIRGSFIRSSVEGESMLLFDDLGGSKMFVGPDVPRMCPDCKASVSAWVC